MACACSKCVAQGNSNLQQGIEPVRQEASQVHATFNGDTILRVPGAGDDRALILATSRRIADAHLKFKFARCRTAGGTGGELAPLNVV
jgi:hypothetical protein